LNTFRAVFHSSTLQSAEGGGSVDRRPTAGVDQPQKLPERVLFHHRVSERQLGMYAVHVAPPVVASLDIARVLEVAEVAEHAVRVTLTTQGFGRPNLR